MLETGDAATSLRQLLSWSHRQLSPPAAVMFALLGVHCGPDITVAAAASLAGIPRPDARRALAELAEASLAAEHRPGRYVMHDLVRGYAAEHSRQAIGQAGIGEAIARSLDHYLHTMIISSPGTPRGYKPAPPAPGVVPERLADAQRLDWARAEHQVLLRATAQAAAAGQFIRSWQIFECQAWFLGGKGYWADFQATGQAILAAAQAAGDHATLGWTHTVIGRYCTFIGAHGDDRAHLAEAVDQFRRAGNLRSQASALLYASFACNWNGDWAQGAVLAEQALSLCLAVRDLPGQGWALVSLGECHAQLGNYERARGYARQALEAAPDTGFVAMAWNVLGLVHFRIREHRQSISCYRQALAIARDWKTPLTRRWRAGLLVNFGDACRAAGDLPAAAEAWKQALQVLDDFGLPDSLRVRARLEQPSP
jgi:tetratricopeptide (TPR) repeat protein